MSYCNTWVRRNLRLLFLGCMWLITLHYFYLFYGNHGDIDWIMGAYIAVTAVGFGMLSIPSLLLYSLFVCTLAIALTVTLPALRHSIFLPGLMTILLQANISLRSRLSHIKSLGDSNRRFEILLNSTFEGVMVHQDGRITDVNAALVKMTGYSRSELVGKNVLQLIHPDDQARLAAQLYQSEYSDEARGVRKDGTTIDIEIRAQNFEANNRRTRLVTILDLTDRKRAERQRMAALILEENLRARDEFISLASHELRTPITSLKLQLQLIAKTLEQQVAPPGNAKLTARLAVCDRQADRLTELIETILDVTRISSGQFVLEIQDIDLSSLIQDVVAGFPPVIAVEVPASVHIRADKSRFRQVLENLLSNALKYGNNKPITVSLKQDQTSIHLIVKDHGIGIANETISRIFERFERGVTAQNISGLGLGLYITRQIVEAHGGTIEVESQIGQGSTFVVSLPRQIMSKFANNESSR